MGSTFRTGLNANPGVLTDWRSLFVAKITARTLATSGPLAGKYVYSWIEQSFDPATATSEDSPTPRKGTYTSATVFTNPLLDVNNSRLTVGTYVWARMKGIVYGKPAYETVHPRVAMDGDDACSGCGWLEDLPTTTCFKFRMDGGEGRCACILFDEFATSGSGNWVNALNGFVATQMKDTCCGCGGVLLEIDDADCRNTTVTLHQFHVSCQTGSAAGLFNLVMKYDCSGINEETGNRFARFVGKGPDACDGDQEPCGNSFYLTVECFECPEEVCGCCCEDWSPWSWYQWDVVGFGDANLNGSWVWEYDDSTPNSCKWIAQCGSYTSTIEYISSGGGKVRLTHHTYVYEIARSSWSCNGANVMTYVSGGGTYPANLTLNPLQTIAPGETPCDLPDSLEVELVSANCPDMNAVVTATRAIPGTGPWEYGTPGSLVVSVECGSDGRFEVAVSIDCDDGSPPPIAFVAGTAPDAPDTASWNPLELTWNNVAITGTPTVAGCCDEGSTVTIIVRE